MDFSKIKNKTDSDFAVVLMDNVGSIAVCRNLKYHGIKVIGISKNPYFLKTKLDMSVHLEKTGDLPGVLSDISEFLRDNSDVYRKPVIFTDGDEYVDLLLKNHDVISKNFIIPYSEDISVTKKLMNMSSLHMLAMASGLKTPRTYYVTNEDRMDESIKSIDFDVVIRPVKSIPDMGRKAVFCENRADIATAFGTYQEMGAAIIIQEYIPGPLENTYCITSYRNKEGRFFFGNMVKKIRQYPVEFGKACCQVTCFDSEIVEYAEHILELSNYTGISMLEFKKHEESGKFYLVHVNCRFPIEMQINNRTNRDFISNVYFDISGRKDYIKWEKPEDFSENIYWINTSKDFKSCIRSHINIFTEYLKYLGRGNVCWGIFSIRDKRFFINYNMSLLVDYITDNE